MMKCSQHLKISIFLSFLILGLSTTYSQTLSADLKWSRLIDWAGASSFISEMKILTDGEGNTCLCGQKHLFNGADWAFLAVKYDSLGNKLWEQTYTKPVLDKMWDCELDSNGNLILCGVSEYLQSNGGVIIKYAPDGEELWVYEYFSVPDQQATYRDILVDEEDNIYVVGTEVVDSVGPFLTLVKISPSGTILWKHHLETTPSYGSYGKILSDRIVILGYSFDSTSNYTLHQVSFEGETIATANNLNQDGFGTENTFDQNGNLYIGDFAGQYKVAKIGLSGDTLWYYELPVVDPPTPTGTYARLKAITTDDQNNAFIAGPHYEGINGFGLVTTMLNENGDSIWSARYTNPSLNTGVSPNYITTYNDLIFVVGDNTIDSLLGRDYLVLVYSKEGELLLDLIYDYQGNQFESIASIDFDAQNMYVTGLTKKTPSVFDSTFYLTQRYCLSGLINNIPAPEVKQEVHIYPNPFGEHFIVEQPKDYDVYTKYELFDIAGQLVQKGFLKSQQEEITVNAQLTSGVYSLVLSNFSEKKVTQLMIKK